MVRLIGSRRRREEKGAVAVVAVLAALVTLGLAALVVDLGMARDYRTRAQNAADASALAAANVLYLDTSKPLATRINDAIAAAKSYANANGVKPAAWAGCTDPQRLTYAPQTPCISFDSATAPTEVRVRVPLEDVPTAFAGAVGGGSMKTAASAHAEVQPGSPVAERGLRPWGICSKVIGTLGTVAFVPMKGGATSANAPNDGCGTEGPPGGWWVAQCESQSNSNGATEQTVLNGCPTTTPYAPVTGQPAGTGSGIREFLTDVCGKKDENANCLGSDPGNNFHNASDEWQTLVGRTITMPVFCFPPHCSQGAYSGTGQNASYAIYKMAKVEICGFEFPPNAPSTSWPTSGRCATANPNGFKSGDVIQGGGLFVVIKALSGGPVPDWELEEGAKDLHLAE